MGNKSNTHSKFFYVNRADIEPYIISGKIDSNDIIYTKDTHETIFINNDLDIISMKSKQHVFDSLTSAEMELNNSSETYVGQLVSIAQGDNYKSYIVEKDEDRYYVTAVDADNIKSVSIEERTLKFYTETSQGESVLVYSIDVPDTDLSELYNAIAIINGDSSINGSIKQIVNDKTIEVKSDLEKSIKEQSSIVEQNTLARHTHDNKDILDNVTSDKFEEWDNKSNFSGDYDDLTNKPSGLSSFENDENYAKLSDIPTSEINQNTVARHTHVNKSVLDKITSSKVASWDNKSNFSGSYNDLTNKPTIPSAYDDTALKNAVSTNTNAIATLNGSGDGSVAKQVSDAVAKIVNDAPESYDTLKEISDWITSHSNDAAEMNSKIEANVTARHTHNNKDVLDRLTDTFVDSITPLIVTAELGENKTIENVSESIKDIITAFNAHKEISLYIGSELLLKPVWVVDNESIVFDGFLIDSVDDTAIYEHFVAIGVSNNSNDGETTDRWTYKIVPINLNSDLYVDSDASVNTGYVDSDDSVGNGESPNPV